MFAIGDKIVYPFYGAGYIENLEMRETTDGKQKFYIIQISGNNLKVFLSAEKAKLLGLRKIKTHSYIVKKLNEVKNTPYSESENWNLRYKENVDKLKSGDFVEVCEVLRSLQLRDKEKGLSNIEKKLLYHAMQIVISELSLAKDSDRAEAEKEIQKRLF